jgi:two-component system response regulator YesN
VPESFQTALLAYERSFYHPYLRFVPYVEHKSPRRRLSLGVDLYSEYVHLLKKEPNKLPEWIESVCGNFCEMEYPGKERIVTLFYSFAQAMLREKSTVWAKMNNICIDESDLERHIQECHSMDEVKRFMLQLTEVYLDEAESDSRYSVSFGMSSNISHRI